MRIEKRKYFSKEQKAIKKKRNAEKRKRIKKLYSEIETFSKYTYGTEWESKSYPEKEKIYKVVALYALLGQLGKDTKQNIYTLEKLVKEGKPKKMTTASIINEVLTLIDSKKRDLKKDNIFWTFANSKKLKELLELKEIPTEKVCTVYTLKMECELQ